MRRRVALAGIATLAVVAAAGADHVLSGSAARPDARARVVPIRATTVISPAGQAAVTRQVCATAEQTTAHGLTVFSHQMALLERAAARNDQTAMISAATAITTEFSRMSATLGRLSKGSVAPPVKVALVQASSAITELGSISYEGTPADQKEELTQLAATFAEACN